MQYTVAYTASNRRYIEGLVNGPFDIKPLRYMSLYMHTYTYIKQGKRYIT